MSGPSQVIIKSNELQDSSSERESIQSFAPGGIQQGRFFKILDKIDGLIVLAIYNVAVAFFVWLSTEKDSNRAEFGNIAMHLSQAVFLFTAAILEKENPKLVRLFAKAFLIANLFHIAASIYYKYIYMNTIHNVVDANFDHVANIVGMSHFLQKLDSQKQKKIA